MNYFDFHTHNKNADNAIINLFHNDIIPNNKIFSIGLHPWHINNNTLIADLDILEKKAKIKNIVAIGECGFDKNIKTDFKIQQEVFYHHFKLSENLKKPLIIHCVGFYEELNKLKKEYKPNQAWIFHGYNQNTIIFNKLVENGFYYSFRKSIIQNDQKIQNLLVNINLTRLFLETDDDSVKIEELYRKMSNLLKINEEYLSKNIFKNIKNITKIK